MADNPDDLADFGDSPFDGVEDVEPDTGSGEFWYPTVEDIVEIHDEIIAEDSDGEPGIEDRERIQYAVDHVQHGTFGEKPETIHEKAFALMRLIASNHWFVDGNKRTALNTTNLFYLLNGYELDYGEDLRAMLKLLAVREDIIDRDVATEYLAEKTEPVDSATRLKLLKIAFVRAVLEGFGIEPEDIHPRSSHTGANAETDNHND